MSEESEASKSATKIEDLCCVISHLASVICTDIPYDLGVHKNELGDDIVKFGSEDRQDDLTASLHALKRLIDDLYSECTRWT